jgi:hypothetical protein
MCYNENSRALALFAVAGGKKVTEVTLNEISIFLLSFRLSPG